MDKSTFMSFLAGFFDAEGSIVYHKKGLGGAFEPYFANMDVELLQRLGAELSSFGLHPKIRRLVQKPSSRVVGGVVGFGDLSSSDSPEVFFLLKEMPIRHREKVSKAAIAVTLPYRAARNERSKVLNEWKALLQKVEDEVLGSIRAAADLCLHFTE